MSTKYNNWLESEIQLLQAIKRHPCCYNRDKRMKRKTYLNNMRLGLLKVSMETGVPVKEFRRKWEMIYFRYAKIKSLLNSGQITPEIVRRHPKTSKFMDGTLEFLDPYINEVTDDTIPKRINIYYNLLFEKEALRSCSKTHEMVKDLLAQKKDEVDDLDENDMAYLLAIVDNAVIESISTIKQENCWPISTLANNGRNENRNIEEVFIEEATFEEESDLMRKQSVNKTTGADEINKCTLTDLPDKIFQTEDGINNTSVDNSMATHDTSTLLKYFLVKYDTDNNYGTDIKQYMKELAEFLCRRLASENRQNFLNQIDLLVSEILEG